MLPRLLLAAALTVVVLAPAAAADHPGSNHGLQAFATLADPLGLDAMVHRLPDVQNDFAAWEAAYPDFVSRYTIGATSSGFPLEGILVTDESVPFDGAALATGQKLRVYLDGGHHGNEFLGVELAMYYLEDLLNKADAGDQAVVQFLKETEVYAVPIINVDGNFLDTRKNSAQVDVNRNYDFQFGGPGSGASVTDQNYRGPSPGSEAEVRANMEFGAEIRPDVWVTMHTGVAEFYWPWGWTHDKSPDDWFFSKLEAPFENATNGRVDAMMAAELYLAAGATDDWAYGVLGIPGHTFEVHEDQFIPVYGEGIPVAIEDQLAGLDFVVKNVKVWGAWLEATPATDGLQLTNLGWNNATGVKLDGEPLADIPAGASVVVPWDGDATVDYQQMLINTSKVRTLHVTSQDAGPAENEAPATGALLALAALAVALARRR
ncbi:MAG: M14 family zinc carboxypeptidase [Candidatus Thermoplasmatota archaeon]